MISASVCKVVSVREDDKCCCSFKLFITAVISCRCCYCRQRTLFYIFQCFPVDICSINHQQFYLLLKKTKNKVISAFYEPSTIKKPYQSTTSNTSSSYMNTLIQTPCLCLGIRTTVLQYKPQWTLSPLMTKNLHSSSFPPAVKASQEMGSRIRRSWKLAFSPRRSPLQVTLWEASGSVSPGQASHLQGPDWESITGSGWEHELVGRREVGAQTIDEKLQACGSPDAWPDYTYTPLIHT